MYQKRIECYYLARVEVGVESFRRRAVTAEGYNTFSAKKWVFEKMCISEKL